MWLVDNYSCECVILKSNTLCSPGKGCKDITVLFIIVVVFHILTKLKSSQHYNWISVNIVRKLRVKLSKLRSALKKLCCKQGRPHHNTPPRVTRTTVELRESLLEYCSQWTFGRVLANSALGFLTFDYIYAYWIVVVLSIIATNLHWLHAISQYAHICSIPERV